MNRALVLTSKYFDGKVPALDALTDFDRETLAELSTVRAAIERELDNFHFREALKEAMNLARLGNKYLADTEPWKLAKTDMERVATILNISLQITANLAIAFAPFLPMSSEKLCKMLAIDLPAWTDLGRSDLIEAGHTLGEASLLFEKIEDDVIEAQIQKLQATKEATRLPKITLPPSLRISTSRTSSSWTSAWVPSPNARRCPRPTSSCSSASTMVWVAARSSRVSLSTMLPRSW